MDTLSSIQRSERMRLIRSTDTAPELQVRRLIYAMGFRYRLHAKSLPGKPDLVFTSRHKVIFVHGCFWHRHNNPQCKLSRLPKTKLDFWLPKLEANRNRDHDVQRTLNEMGWSVMVIWECELQNIQQLKIRISEFLNESS